MINKWWKKLINNKESTPELDEQDLLSLNNRSTTHLDEVPRDIQSRLICHVPDFVWTAEVSP